MKQTVYAIFLFLFSASASAEICLDNFTNNYFDWLRRVVTENPGETILERLQYERGEMAPLRDMLIEAQKQTCEGLEVERIQALLRQSESYESLLNTTISDLLKKKYLTMPDEFVQKKLAYRKVNADMVNYLRFHTGIRW